MTLEGLVNAVQGGMKVAEVTVFTGIDEADEHHKRVRLLCKGSTLLSSMDIEKLEKLAVEIDGGIFVCGRHVDPLGGHGDRDKLNRAAVLGWKVLRYDAKHLRDDPHGVFEELMQALGAFSEEEHNP